MYSILLTSGRKFRDGKETSPKVIPVENLLTEFFDDKYKLECQWVNFEDKTEQPEQPINSGEFCSWARVLQMLDQTMEMRPRFVISIENEIVDYGHKDYVYDRAWAVVFDTNTMKRYIGFSDAQRIRIPRVYLDQAIDRHNQNVKSGQAPVNYARNGLSVTVGKMIVQDPKYCRLPADNWMQHMDFGGYNRIFQIQDALRPCLKQALKNR